MISIHSTVLRNNPHKPACIPLVHTSFKLWANEGKRKLGLIILFVFGGRNQKLEVTTGGDNMCVSACSGHLKCTSTLG